MPHVALFHGYAEVPEAIWFPYIKQALEPLGHRVLYQILPKPREPHLQAWLEASTPLTSVWNKRTIVVGHSLGGLLALRLLERPDTPAVHAVITVGSPFAIVRTRCKSLCEFLAGGLNAELLRHKADRFLVVHAEDDRVVPISHARRYADALHGELRRSKDGGHFMDHEAPFVLRVIREVLADFV